MLSPWPRCEGDVCTMSPSSLRVYVKPTLSSAVLVVTDTSERAHKDARINYQLRFDSKMKLY